MAADSAGRDVVAGTGAGAGTGTRAVVVRADDAEYVPLPHGGGFTLLTDGGPLSANRLALAAGATGARPHFHARSAELFHVLDGTVEFRLDGAVEAIGAGGVVLIPPGLPHAFGATADGPAELLAVLGSPVERFGYFRALGRIQHGLQPFEDLLPEQDRYDVHFVDRA
ncbi:cupin domain-containing protein [Streptomyces sp. NPDC059456]|uniref:cupin domain-containing protein n=1 Tax=Streptomyces sp. NPDC059456 TaxID=3346838 RepID=UPI0036C2A13C